MIKKVQVKNFKKYRDQAFNIHTNGVSLFVGGNNSGKSTVIHALAIWEFCKMILAHEQGNGVFLERNMGKGEGFGMSAEEFLPVAVPSLNHLWTNLKVQIPRTSPFAPKDKYPGYTLRISCMWDSLCKDDLFLEIGLSLVNDRLFMRITNTNLSEEDKIPSLVYLPTFAGVLPKERRATIAERRAYLGQGMAGSVLRNMIYELYKTDLEIRNKLFNDKKRLTKEDNEALAKISPFIKLQNLLCEVFRVELSVVPFNERFHTILQINERKVLVDGGKYKPISKGKYTPRDIMLQGSGFLQWTSIFCILLNENVDVLLLDEPDAHLHTTLQSELFSRLEQFASINSKQIILSTHSIEMIKKASYDQIFTIDKKKYLSDDEGKVSVISGIGSSYFPKFHKLQLYKRIVFIENESDKKILTILGEIAGIKFPENVVIWESTASHSERIMIYKELKKQIPDLKGISLRDRDLESTETVDDKLHYKPIKQTEGIDILCLQWRRRNIESYLICPQIIADLSGNTVLDITNFFQEKHALSIPQYGYINTNAPENILILDGKKVFALPDIGLQVKFNCNKYDIAKKMQSDWVCEDIKIFLNEANDYLK